MTLDDIPLFSMLKSRLDYLNQRQGLISENVANANTPGYQPRDLKPFTIKGSHAGAPLALASVQLTPAHMAGSVSESPAWAPEDSPDSEGRLDGGHVVLEDEMMKLTDARMNFETAIGFYQKSLSLIQLAIHTPGKGA